MSAGRWASRVPLGTVLSAYLLSATCTAVAAVAVPWFVLTSTGSPARTGVVVFAQMAPYVAIQAVAGPWVERVGLRRVSVAGNVLAGVVLVLAPALFVVDQLDFARLIAVAAATGALRGAADCASAPLIPGAARMSGTPLERASGLHATVSQTGLLVGAPLAGVLLSVLDPPLVLLLGAAGFALAGAVVVVGVPHDLGHAAGAGRAGDPSSAAPAEPYLARLRAGLSFIAHDPLLRGIVVLVAAANLFAVAMNGVLLPSWVHARELPVTALGTVTGALALGGLVGSLIGAWLGPRLRRWATFSVGLLVGLSPLYFTLALSSSALVAATVAALGGLAHGGVNPVIGAVQYERIPAEMLARVLGAVKASAWVGVPFGPVMAGFAIEHTGITATLVAFGLVLLTLTLGPFVIGSFRLLDERPATVSVEPTTRRLDTPRPRSGTT